MKYIFIDIDGTLVSALGEIPLSAIKAIKKTREKGNKVFICSARVNGEVYDHIKAIGFDGMILGSGAQIFIDNELIKLYSFDEEVNELIDDLNKMHLGFYLETNEALIGNTLFKEKANIAFKDYDPRQELNVDIVFPQMLYDIPLKRNDILKINYVLEDMKHHNYLKDKYHQYDHGFWGGNNKYQFGDISQKDINKGNAIKWLKEYLNIDKKDCLAFGDSYPDILMFKECKEGIAMGNGSKECKENATYITDDLEDDGIYNAFKKFDLI